MLIALVVWIGFDKPTNRRTVRVGAITDFRCYVLAISLSVQVGFDKPTNRRTVRVGATMDFSLLYGFSPIFFFFLFFSFFQFATYVS